MGVPPEPGAALTHEPADPRQAFMALEARRLRYAFTYDPILAVSVSKVDPLPHQIEAVYGHVLKKSRIRFMLAHDPGAGKTIMAGLAIKELKMRRAIRRILIVVPGQLKEQWRWELKDKFDEDFAVVDREYLASRNGPLAWDGDQLITSLDFAKQDDVMASLDGARFDMIIVDEAHKMSAYAYGSTTSKTRRYRLGERLTAMSRHMLFLTATPHKGDVQNFRLLLDLLEPGFFATNSMMEESIRNRDNPLFLRRAKEDMKGFDGRPLFVPRTVETPDLQLSRPEKKLYGEMSKYITEQYNLATQSVKRHNITFALILLQRRFASSTFALHGSLRRRQQKLRQLEDEVGKLGAGGEQALPGPLEYADGMTEKEQWDEEKKWELITVAQNRAELAEEIGILGGLISKAEGIIRKGSESKLNQLRSMMEYLDRNHPGEKMLIFTEFLDTLNHLVESVRSWGYSVNTIHGAMPPDERKRAEEVFRDNTRVMVATEAAGEGINLQFCHLMINYDLPWNPNRLEQRMGRIHRYGQKYPVSVFNLVYSDTREGEIMRVLFEKLEEIKNAMGSDKIFDVISEVVQGRSLKQMMRDATVRTRKQSEILTELRGRVTPENEHVADYMKDSLATKYMDYTALSGMRDMAEEGRLVPEYTRDLFRRILDAAGGWLDGDGDLAYLELPDRLLEPAGGPVRPSYHTVTFDKRVRLANPGTELIAFGHPAFDAALDWAEREYSDAALGGAVFADPAGRMDGHLVFCEGAVLDGSGNVAGKKMIACLVDERGSALPVSPSVILDLDRSPAARPAGAGLEGAADSARLRSAEEMAAYAVELAAERNRHAELVRRYGLKSIDSLIESIGDDVVALLAKKREGAKVDLAIRNKRETRRKYRQSRRDMGARMRLEGDLSVGEISVVGIARVVPLSGDASYLKEAALDRVMRFERRSGRTPELVAGTGRGFDIRSVGRRGTVRYILAKPAPKGEPITLTFNEWFRARTLGPSCYLYLLRDGRNDPQGIRDPAHAVKAACTASGYEVVLPRPGRPRSAGS